MYAEGCRAAVLDRGGSASQSEITDITFNWPRFTPAPCRSLARKMSATPSVKRDTRAAIWAAAQAAAIRSRDADENSLFSCRELELPRPIWDSSV